MTDISLDLRRIAYPSDQNAAVSAWRAYTEALLASLVRFSCLSGSAGFGYASLLVLPRRPQWYWPEPVGPRLRGCAPTIRSKAATPSLTAERPSQQSRKKMAFGSVRLVVQGCLQTDSFTQKKPMGVTITTGTSTHWHGRQKGCRGSGGGGVQSSLTILPLLQHLRFPFTQVVQFPSKHIAGTTEESMRDALGARP
jgi:hypothetical protein